MDLPNPELNRRPTEARRPVAREWPRGRRLSEEVRRLSTARMNPDYSKRDFLLPEGCKDLMDVLKLEAQRTALLGMKPRLATFPPVAALTGELLIPAHTTVLQLAGLLKKKPMRINLDLMDIGIFASITGELDFDTASPVAGRYGYIGRKAA